jgi:hypothetical protein
MLNFDKVSMNKQENVNATEDGKRNKEIENERSIVKFSEIKSGEKSSEIHKAIRSGDLRLALDTFLRLNESLPTTGRSGRQFNYSGEFAKEIIGRAIRMAKKDGSSPEDKKFAIDSLNVLSPYLPNTGLEGQAFDYAGAYAKDIIHNAIRAAKKDSSDPEGKRRAIAALDALGEYLPTADRYGKPFDYVHYYAADITRLK